MKRISTVIAITTTLLALTVLTAHAGSTTITARYDSADTINRVCDGCTESSASADTSGRIQAVTTVRSPAFDGDPALASATGRVFASTNGSSKTRSIKVTFTVNVAGAKAWVRTGSVNGGYGRAEIDAIVFVWCTGCPSGYRNVGVQQRIADSDPTTPAPAEMTNNTLTIPVSITLAANERLSGGIFAHIESQAFAQLGTARLPLDERVVHAESEVTLTSVEIVTT